MSETKPTKKEIEDIFKQEPVKFNKYRLKALLLRKFLGTVPRDKNIYSSYIASLTEDKNKQEEETETVDEIEEKGWTGFHKDDEGTFFYNYMVLGNIKSNLKILIDSGAVKKITAYKKICDTCVKVYPRRIRFTNKNGEDIQPKETPDGSMERAIRAMTAKGERTFISRSDYVDKGAFFEFDVKLIKNKNNLTPTSLLKALKLGEEYGLGQWRGSGGYGAFAILDCSEV